MWDEEKGKRKRAELVMRDGGKKMTRSREARKLGSAFAVCPFGVRCG